MSVLGIDIGSSTTKVIEYKDNKIENKLIIRDGFSKEKLNDPNITVQSPAYQDYQERIEISSQNPVPDHSAYYQ